MVLLAFLYSHDLHKLRSLLPDQPIHRHSLYRPLKASLLNESAFCCGIAQPFQNQRITQDLSALQHFRPEDLTQLAGHAHSHFGPGSSFLHPHPALLHPIHNLQCVSCRPLSLFFLWHEYPHIHSAGMVPYNLRDSAIHVHVPLNNDHRRNHQHRNGKPNHESH